MYVAAALELRDGDRGRLEALTRASTVSAGLAMRARIVLLAADGVANTDIADRTGTSRPTVLKWRGRYEQSGVDGLDDDPRPGRAAVIDEIAVLAETLADKGKPPAHLGVTHWSTRLMAERLGISFASVARIWRKWGIQPHRVETFKFSTDPQLEAKLRDVVGLYLDPPAGAVVVSVDEKSQIQALDRTQPILPLRQGIPEQQTHDYIRHGTTSLFAALEVATGKVTADACYPRHTNVEFLAFLKLVAKAHPRVRLCVICDNYVPRTIMLNAGLPARVSLAGQGVTDQVFHIIFPVSIEASWIELGDLRGVSDGQEGVVPGGAGAVVGVLGGVRGMAADTKLFAVGDL